MERMNRKIALRSPSQNNPPESRIAERESSSSRLRTRKQHSRVFRCLIRRLYT
jgi:hypothetical protein